jgi:hypothetical protein
MVDVCYLRSCLICTRRVSGVTIGLYKGNKSSYLQCWDMSVRDLRKKFQSFHGLQTLQPG